MSYSFNSQISTLSIAIITALSISSTAFGGISSSGGGTGIFCEKGRQPKVQMLDTYEGAVLEGYTYNENKEPYRKQLQKIFDKLDVDPSVKYPFKHELEDILANMKFLPKGVSINAPGDIGNEKFIPVPTGCSLGGIGFYQEGRLTISTDAFSKLSETQKAVFFAHEALYKLYRIGEDRNWNNLFKKFGQVRGEVTAADTRKLVAALFSKQATNLKLFNLASMMSARYGRESVQTRLVKPAPGMEKNLPYEIAPVQDYGLWENPIIIARPSPTIEVSLTGIAKSSNDFSISCRTGGILPKTVVTQGPAETTVRFDIPSSCEMMFIRVEGNGQAWPDSNITVRVDGQDYFTTGPKASFVGSYRLIYKSLK